MNIRNKPFVRKLLGGLDHLKLLAAMSQHSAWHYWDSVNWWNRLKFVEISLSGSCWSIHHGFFSKVALINKNGISGFLLSLRAWANAQTWTHFLSWIDTCGYAQARPTPDKWKAGWMITCLRHETTWYSWHQTITWGYNPANPPSFTTSVSFPSQCQESRRMFPADEAVKSSWGLKNKWILGVLTQQSTMMQLSYPCGRALASLALLVGVLLLQNLLLKQGRTTK